MSDLVQRLKTGLNASPAGTSEYLLAQRLLAEAADEIERLRNKLNTDSQHFQIECHKAQIELLRQERDEARTAVVGWVTDYNELVRRLATLMSSNAEAISLLRELEWVYPQAGPPFCQECRRDKEKGHASNCRLAAFFKKT